MTLILKLLLGLRSHELITLVHVELPEFDISLTTSWTLPDCILQCGLRQVDVLLFSINEEFTLSDSTVVGIHFANVLTDSIGVRLCHAYEITAKALSYYEMRQLDE